MKKIPLGANKQVNPEIFAITPYIPGGLMNASKLKKIAEVAEKYNLTVKITSGQQIALIGLKADKVEQAWKDLGMKPESITGLTCRGVRFCPGNTFCKRARQETIKLGKKLDTRWRGTKTPAKMKISISGCHLSCTAPAIRDIGIIGTDDGYNILVGGSGAHDARIAWTLIKNRTAEEVEVIFEAIMKFYMENAKITERVGNLIKRIGIEKFRRKVFNLVDNKYLQYRPTTVKYEYMEDDDQLCGIKKEES
ncbi:NAD(P)/FAD-dependent oxidoreductase [Anoxybacter fermentans]|nr:NAD(P)/FAD-dependent oxidoreductase [Anoxybacter fermentans]